MPVDNPKRPQRKIEGQAASGPSLSNVRLGRHDELERTSVKVLHWKCREVNAFEAPDIDYHHGISRENAFDKRMNATPRAEPVLDTLLSEGVFSGVEARVIFEARAATGGYAYRAEVSASPSCIGPPHSTPQ